MDVARKWVIRVKVLVPIRLNWREEVLVWRLKRFAGSLVRFFSIFFFYFIPQRRMLRGDVFFFWLALYRNRKFEVQVGLSEVELTIEIFVFIMLCYVFTLHYRH